MTVQYKEFKTDDIFDIRSSKGIFHACNINIFDEEIHNSHPYVVRTSQRNGIKGYLIQDEKYLNPANTISFAQDTAQIFYQNKAYFTGNKIKVLYLKGHKLTGCIALYLTTCLNKSFNMFEWGQSFDSKILQNIKLYLPYITRNIPDWSALDAIVKTYNGGGVRYE